MDTSQAMLERARSHGEASTSAGGRPHAPTTYVHWPPTSEILQLEPDSYDREWAAAAAAAAAAHCCCCSSAAWYCFCWLLPRPYAVLPPGPTLCLHRPPPSATVIVSCLGLHWVNDVPVRRHEGEDAGCCCALLLPASLLSVPSLRQSNAAPLHAACCTHTHTASLCMPAESTCAHASAEACVDAACHACMKPRRPTPSESRPCGEACRHVL